jgi:hypothetical protein
LITLEIIEQLTPERIKALSREEKEEALTILEALEIPRLERRLRQFRAQSQEQREQAAIGLAGRVEAVRRKLEAMTPEERAAYDAKRSKEIEEWRDWQGIGRNADTDEVKAIWRKLREVNPRAGGVGVDHLLGVETPPEPAVQRPVDQEPAPKPVAAPKVLTPAEWARQESERVQQEAEQFQRSDFLTQVCGIGYTTPSGKANRRWDA